MKKHYWQSSNIRFSRVKQRVSPRRKNKIFNISVFLFFGIVITSGLFYLSFNFVIKNFLKNHFIIEEFDLSKFPPEKIYFLYNVLKKFHKKNYFEIPKTQIKDEIIKRFPQIKDINFRFWNKKLKLIPYLRNPVAKIKIDENFLAFDSEGVLFVASNLDLPEVLVADYKLQDIARFISQIEKFSKTKNLKIVKYNFNKKDCILYLNDGTKVFWGEYNDDSIDKKIISLKNICKEFRKKFENFSIDYIDLKFFKFGNIYLKPSNQTT